jgi:arylsulfatase A-like enzyme
MSLSNLKDALTSIADRWMGAAPRRTAAWPRRAAIGALALLSIAACGEPERPGIPPRHFLLVTAGGLRADHVSCFQYGRPTTDVPSDIVARKEQRAMGLDDLAASGVIFANGFAPSPSTTASLASLFTGRSPIECGVTSDADSVPDDVPTLAELFHDRGFATAAFTASPRLDLEGALHKGFDTFVASADDRAAFDAASEWLMRDSGTGQPSFVWIHLSGLETPWVPRESEASVAEKVAQRAFGDPRYNGPFDGSAARFEALDDGQLRLAPPDVEAAIAQYDREVVRLSAGLARFLTRTFDYNEPGADASESWARTVFVFAGATGMQLGEDGAIGHAGSLHESVIHVPIVVRHPDSLTGARIESAVVELQDLLPTCVEWFDLKTPARVQGRSLLPLVDSYVVRPFQARAAVAALQDRVFSVRSQRLHLVWNPLKARPKDRPKSAADIVPQGLYEPERDRFEREDLSADLPRELSALQAVVKTWRDAQITYPPEKKPKRKTPAGHDDAAPGASH